MKKIIYTVQINHKDLRKQLIWKSGCGFLLLKDMEDEHVINAALYLSKKVKELKEFGLPLYNINDRSIKCWLKIFKNELKYRKLS